MLKYYVLLFFVLVFALFYVYIRDPCNRQVRTDFSNKYPSYKILDTGATEGSPERVRCSISYLRPDSEEVFKDIWLYLYSKRGWEFSTILETPAREQAP